MKASLRVFSEIDASANSAAANSGPDRYAGIAFPRLTRLAATAPEAPPGPSVVGCVALLMPCFLPFKSLDSFLGPFPLENTRPPGDRCQNTGENRFDQQMAGLSR